MPCPGFQFGSQSITPPSPFSLSLPLLLCYFISSSLPLSPLSVYIYIYIYSSESKVLQYFGSMRHNSIAPDVFANVVKLTNNTELSDAELVWYSPSATCRICLFSLKHSFWIYGFKSTWSAHQLPRYYQLQQVLNKAWTDPATWYAHLSHKKYCQTFNCPYSVYVWVCVWVCEN